MSLHLAKLLDQPEPQVAKLIAQLEDKNGYPSHDVRFLAKTSQNARSKIAELGLDPDDTTGEELYQALLTKFSRDSQLFDKQLGAEALDFDEKSTKAQEILRQQFELPRQWALKKSAAKQILISQPPKRLMKRLHYRSITSMLKREKLEEIYLGAQYLESASWHKQHNRLVSKLDQTNFELRPIKTVKLNWNRWLSLSGPEDYIALNNDLGVMSIWPAHDLEKAPLLTLMILLSEKIGDYRKVKISNQLAKTGALVVWWVGMDHLIANLGGEVVSLSLKDNALNALMAQSFETRNLDHSRQTLWQQLLDCYEKLPDTEGLFVNSIKDGVSKIKYSPPKPAYEFVEDF